MSVDNAEAERRMFLTMTATALASAQQNAALAHRLALALCVCRCGEPMAVAALADWERFLKGAYGGPVVSGSNER